MLINIRYGATREINANGKNGLKQLITHEGVKIKENCLKILYIVFSKLSNDVSQYCYFK